MKLLVILNGLGIGGAERYNTLLINEFCKRGIYVELIVLSNRLELLPEINNSVKTHVFARKRPVDFPVIQKISNHIKQNKFDVIVTSNIIYTRISCFIAGKLNILRVYPIHSSKPLRSRYAIINFLLFHTQIKREIFIASSTTHANFLKGYYRLSKNAFEIVNNGIDTNTFSLKPSTFDARGFLKSYGISSENKIILMVANYRPEKNHIVAIEAFKLLTQDTGSIQLVFIGNDSQNLMESITTHAKRASAAIISLRGISNDDLLKFYWSADVFTLTSDTEAFPITALEAMATGLPCVITDVGGIKDFIIPGINGEISTVRNPQSIKEKWLQVLNNQNNYQENRIREYVQQNFSINQSASNYLQILTKHNAQYYSKQGHD